MYLPKGVQMQSPIGAKWSPSCPKRWPSVVSVLSTSEVMPCGLHFHLATRCIEWMSLILLQRLECLLLWRNGVIVKSGMQDWRRVGHYLVGMAITAPCDHFVDSWQPIFRPLWILCRSRDVHLMTFWGPLWIHWKYTARYQSAEPGKHTHTFKLLASLSISGICILLNQQTLDWFLFL